MPTATGRQRRWWSRPVDCSHDGLFRTWTGLSERTPTPGPTDKRKIQWTPAEGGGQQTAKGKIVITDGTVECGGEIASVNSTQTHAKTAPIW